MHFPQRLGAAPFLSARWVPYMSVVVEELASHRNERRAPHDRTPLRGFLALQQFVTDERTTHLCALPNSSGRHKLSIVLRHLDNDALCLGIGAATDLNVVAGSATTRYSQPVTRMVSPSIKLCAFGSCGMSAS